MGQLAGCLEARETAVRCWQGCLPKFIRVSGRAQFPAAVGLRVYGPCCRWPETTVGSRVAHGPQVLVTLQLLLRAPVLPHRSCLPFRFGASCGYGRTPRV